MRIAIAGLLHESNSFMPAVTTRENFVQCSLVTGADLIERYRGTHHEVGGFIDGADRFGFDIVPLMMAVAMPSGPLTPETFDGLAGEMLEAISGAGELDGLLLALHGAMVAEDHPDADGEIARRVRDLVGPGFPVVMTLDMHANVSARTIANTTAAVFYRSNPHLDQRARGVEAAEIIARTVRREIRPVQALETPPLLINIVKQYTSQPPSLALVRDCEAVIGRPGILSASVALGFAYADVEEMGSAFLAVADGDERAARDAARWMAQRAWDLREQFVGDLPSPTDAVRAAAASEGRPIVLMDVGDNVGGGGPGDSTILFREIVEQNVPEGLVVLYDPQAVAQCAAAGVRSEVAIEVGGKTDDRHGPRVPIRGRVTTLSAGLYVEEQPRHGGRRNNDQGVTAVVETDRTHTVVLTSFREAPMSIEQLLSLGIKPERKKLLIVKGVVAPRAAYEPIAHDVVLVDTPGATAANPAHFDYRRRRTPMFPFEPNAHYPPTPT